MTNSYAIFGAGLSAQAARRLARSKGFEVVLIDEAGQGDQRTFDADDISKFDCFIFSPGFAEAHPWRVLVQASGLPCLSELAFAARYWEGRIIGVTGTNGKSTLTELLARALQLSGSTSVAAGNIGYPFSDAVLSASNSADAHAVLEISSFQAELADCLELDALVWTNFAEDHLDRYPSMRHYFKAKARLLNCLKEGAPCVIGPQVAPMLKNLCPKFALRTHASEDSPYQAQLGPDSVFHRFPYSENFSLAAELWSLLRQEPTPLIKAANTFRLAPHRLAAVAEFGEMRFWDDSKATNFHATLAAVHSIKGPIVWIGGGRAKGGNMAAFAQEVGGQVNAAILYGEVAECMAQALDGSAASVQVHPCFENAVRAAAEVAATMPVANVLLSPGFSSFDQFKSYEERGKSFRRIVLGLKNAGRHL